MGNNLLPNMQKTDIHWQCHSFNSLNKLSLYQLLQLRTDVFVVEQHCAYPELDGKDILEHTHHLLGYDKEKLIAYARILAPDTNNDNPRISRIVIEPSARGNGTGHQLVQIAIKCCRQLWPQADIDIAAQAYLQTFYTQHGFNPISQVYLESHINMRFIAV